MGAHLHINFAVPGGAMTTRLKAAVQRESRQQTALALFKHGACSAGYAAKMLRLNLRDFFDLLREHGIPYSEASPEAQREDRSTLAWMRQQSKGRRASA